MGKIVWTLENWKTNEKKRYFDRLKWYDSVKELYMNKGEFEIFGIRELAQIYAFEGNKLESKKYFYKQTRLAIEFYNIYLENRYPNLTKSEVPPATYVGSLLSAILCDNEAIFEEYANIIECYEDPNRMSEESYHFFYAFKYLFLKDFNQSREHFLKGTRQEKSFKIHMKSFSYVLKGVLGNSVELINEGLTYSIKYHKRGNPKGSLFHQYSIEATALAKLSMMYGFEPDVSSPFIHKGLLEKTEGIVYEGIEEITDALEEANRRAGSLWGKIGKWLE